VKKTISIFLALCLLFCSFAYAHNVREDANGGHKDKFASMPSPQKAHKSYAPYSLRSAEHD
jgi:hypothetical protein